MKVSELIDELQRLYERYGDLNVKAEMNGDGKFFDVCNAVPEYRLGDVKYFSICGECEQEMPEGYRGGLGYDCDQKQ